jgi:hypothetical protein
MANATYEALLGQKPGSARPWKDLLFALKGLRGGT